MKYKLLQNMPWKKAWEIIDWAKEYEYECRDYPDFFEPIVEKKTYDDLRFDNTIFEIKYDWSIKSDIFVKHNCRSETFPTREEAEDEHKRREYSVRPSRFVPKEWEYYYAQWWTNIERWKYDDDPLCNLIVNLWLAFRTREECQDAIDNHDLIRLFYTIR